MTRPTDRGRRATAAARRGSGSALKSRADAAGPITIVGAGAAGLMAAIFAAGGGRRVVVVERTKDGGRKILISGGGRGNVLPGELEEARMVTDSSPHTLRKILRSWPLSDQQRFFEGELGVPLKLERDSGKLFPVSDRARDVRDALVEAARRRGVEFLFGAAITTLEPPSRAAGSWMLGTAAGARIAASAVVLATGGLSVPATGSDGLGLRLAYQLGHELRPTYAALTPLTLAPSRFGDLAGISLDVTLQASADRRSFKTRGGFLFTHRGYSGPSVLDMSHLAVRSVERTGGGAGGPQIFVQWTDLGREDWEHELAPRRASVVGVLCRHLPARLAAALQREAAVPLDRSLAELRSEERRRLLDALGHFELPWTGHEGYRTAEVTGGGVALSEIDPRSLESRHHRGLFLCGEMLDAFGPIGGYNFVWAWVTGRAAGLAAGRGVRS